MSQQAMHRQHQLTYFIQKRLPIHRPHSAYNRIHKQASLFDSTLERHLPSPLLENNSATSKLPPNNHFKLSSASQSACPHASVSRKRGERVMTTSMIATTTSPTTTKTLESVRRAKMCLVTTIGTVGEAILATTAMGRIYSRMVWLRGVVGGVQRVRRRMRVGLGSVKVVGGLTRVFTGDDVVWGMEVKRKI